MFSTELGLLRDHNRKKEIREVMNRKVTKYICVHELVKTSAFLLETIFSLESKAGRVGDNFNMLCTFLVCRACD